MGRYNGTPMRLDLHDETVRVFRRQYPLSLAEKDVVRTQVEGLLENGLIEVSHGLHGFATPTLIAPKKDSNGITVDWRMCGDYRALNAATLPDPYPMPTPEEIFDSMYEARIFTVMDLRQGFYQIPIEPAHAHRTAFWGGAQLYQWKFMPFGLRNAPAKFQRVMDEALKGLAHTRCYMDDVITFSTDLNTHLLDLQEVFNTLETSGLKCHPGKSTFAVGEVLYLGHWITPGKISPQAAKVVAIDGMKAPTNVSELRTFLGLANYYRKFIHQFSAQAQPLNLLLRLDTVWTWGPLQETAFTSLKLALRSDPVLRMPNPLYPYTLYTDWSTRGLGAVLAQVEPGTHDEYVVAYASRSNNRAESKYSSHDGELLAVVWAILHFRIYLYGVRFTLITDHEPLKWLMTQTKLMGRKARWVCTLQEFDFEVIHRSGLTHGNADSLSRSPLDTPADFTSARLDHDRDAPLRTSFCLSQLSHPVLLSLHLATSPGDDRLPVGGGSKDIWDDVQVLDYLQFSVLPTDATSHAHILSRAATFQWVNTNLVHTLADGNQRVVPPPEERGPLIRHLHRRCGHFGQKRTLSLLRNMYWWPGLDLQVRHEVRSCSLCDQVKSGMHHADPAILHSLPIMGMFYRWSLDMAGPFPISRRGNRYILVMIEHFSKWIEVVVLPRKESRLTADAFLQRILTLYGAPAEVLTDNGTEFEGEFQTLLELALIDHRRTSRDHPQADGLAERLVQTFKLALRKYALDVDKKTWDNHVPWITMGYRFSNQASLGHYSPYYLLFGRTPPLPGSQMTSTPPDDADIPDMLLQRADAFKRAMPIAMGNLRIAQHRDQLWYSRKRSGSYLPRVYRFEVGDHVYIATQSHDTLDATPSRQILRISAITDDTGILTLAGPDGAFVKKEHMKNCYPCHLPQLISSPNLHKQYVPEEVLCVGCSKVRANTALLVCGICYTAYHPTCLPPGSPPPADHWQCASCSES